MKKSFRKAVYWLSSFIIVILLIILTWEFTSGVALKHLARFFADRAGIALDIGSVGGGIFYESVLTDVSIRPEEDQPQTFHFEARSLRCRYDPWKLRDGLGSFIEEVDCTVEEPAYLQDFSVAAPREETPDGEPSKFSLPPFIPALRVNNGKVILTGTGWTVRFLGVNSRLGQVDSGPELLLDAESFRFDQDSITRIETGLAARLRYADGDLIVDRLELGAEEIKASGSLELARIGRGETEFTADLVFGKSRLDLAGSLEERVLKARAGTESFAVGELQKRLGGKGWDISGDIRAEAELALDLQAPAELEGAFTFALVDGLVNKVEISAAAAGRVENKRLEITRAGAEFTGGTLALTDVSVPVEPIMTAKPLPIIKGSKAKFTAEITDLDNVLKLFGLEARTVPKAYRAESLSFRGTLADGALHLEESVADFRLAIEAEGWDITGEIRAEVQLDLDLEAPTELEGAFTFALVDGRVNKVEISAAAAGRVENKRLEITRAGAKFTGGTLALTEVSVPVERIMAAEPLPIIKDSRAEFTAEITDLDSVLKLFGLEAGTVPKAYRAESLSLRGTLADGVLQLKESVATAADFRLAIGSGKIGIPADLPAWGAAPVKLSATLESSDLNELVGRFAEIPLSGRAAAGIDIKGKLLDVHAEIKLSGDTLGFGEKQLGSLDLSVALEFLQEKPGVPGQLRFKITGLSQENETGVLGLDAPVSGSWSPTGDLTVGGALMVDGQGVVTANFEMTPGQVSNYEISVDNLDSDGWLGHFVEQHFFFQGAYLEGSFTRPPQGPRLALTGKVAKSGAIDIAYPLTGKFDLLYSPKGVEISEFSWQSRENRLQLSGSIPYDPMAEEPFLDGELALKGRADIPALENIALFPESWGIGGGSLAMDLDLNGSWDQPEGYVILKAEEIVPTGKVEELFASPIDLTGELLVRKDGVVLKRAMLESERYSGQATGSYRHNLSIEELLQKPRSALDGEVSLDGAVRLKDLNFLSRRLSWLRRLEGDLRGEVHVEGPLAAPGIKGSLSLRDGEASHTFNFPMLSAVNLQADFNEQSITINKMRAELGGAPINLGGRISRGENGLNFDLHGDGKNVLLFRNNYMLARGNVKLEVNGPLERLAFTGSVGLSYGYYTRNIDFLGKIGSSAAPVSEGVGSLFSFPEPPLKNAVFNIRITAIEPFRIRNNLIRSSLRPELSLKGTGELPYLAGTIYIDSSRILLPSGRLQIQSGVVVFLEEDPNRPRLDIIGRSQVMGYDINVVTSGPVTDPVITLSSSPALPNDDLLLLLLTGKPPPEDASGEEVSGTRNVMVYLGRDFLGKWLEDDSGTGDESLLDRFELDLGRNVTRSGEQTIEATFRLSKELEEEEEVYYLSAEKDMYDAYNYGLKVVFRFE